MTGWSSRPDPDWDVDRPTVVEQRAAVARAGNGFTPAMLERAAQGDFTYSPPSTTPCTSSAADERAYHVA